MIDDGLFAMYYVRIFHLKTKSTGTDSIRRGFGGASAQLKEIDM
jgi:hypothetical protein